MRGLLAALAAVLVLAVGSVPVLAHCPLCSAATGAAVAVARWYGIDDLLVGVALGAFTISTSWWLHLTLRKRGINIPFQHGLVQVAGWVAMFVTLWVAGLLNGAFVVWGVDKLFVGLLAGSVAAAAAFGGHEALRRANGGRNYMPFQAVLLVVASMVLAGAGFVIGGLV